jgi:uncharacterized protein (DUF1697 family)
MIKYVAFLRAVNVGGHGILKMDALRWALEDLGLINVTTVLQNGNAIFEGEAGDAGGLERKIEKCLRVSLGIKTTVILRTFREIERLILRDPFADEDQGRAIKRYITFLVKKPSGRFDVPLLSNKDGLEIFSIEGREAFVLSRPIHGRYGFPNAFVEEALRVTATSRNWNTVLRLAPGEIR